MHIKTTVWEATCLDFKMILYIIQGVHNCWHVGNKHQFANGRKNSATNAQHLLSSPKVQALISSFVISYSQHQYKASKFTTLSFFSYALTTTTTKTTYIVLTIHKGLLSYRGVKACAKNYIVNLNCRVKTRN